MATKLVYIGVVILALIAIFLGYKIYEQKTTYRQNDGLTPSPITSKTPVTYSPSTAPTPLTKNVAEDRKIISSYPGPNATDDQKKEFGTIIGNNAQVSDTLDITGCETSPLVLKVKNGSSIKLINNDYTVNAILFGPGIQYEVPSKSSISITVNLGAGINTYRCTGISGSPIVGAFVVAE